MERKLRLGALALAFSGLTFVAPSRGVLQLPEREVALQKLTTEAATAPKAAIFLLFISFTNFKTSLIFIKSINYILILLYVLYIDLLLLTLATFHLEAREAVFVAAVLAGTSLRLCTSTSDNRYPYIGPCRCMHSYGMPIV